ncbi:flagellar basal-body rod protein FlgG [Anaerosporomusa subterranea]|jgi:flagellar basal-body rod protein FlgG|uniref:Flagellar basal-body rod protein FlgG n=1 Tax=Anaerosporomusa subterranea TaxID=1794912 RepID=A0A154BR93_ANASB|nr:flagellar hook-basal body protein [Anaerosporomusa subterranea]KYZ76350.1 flagellar basal-body rod protein FlgG [Anaerosporomusa subterranea]MDF2501391.1 flgG 2 [Anaerosporomusa subterranea]
MIKGIYTAASGMLAESIRTDATANNLANVNTAGFKKDAAVNKSFADMLISRINDGPVQPVGSVGTGAEVDEIVAIHTQGMMRHTGNPLDLAIEGQSYFAVETPAGVRYTRNGAFSRNSLGELTTADGHAVLAENGRLVVNGSSVTVSEEGIVSVDGIEAGRLRLAEFNDEKRLIKEGSSLFQDTGAGQKQATGLVRQGTLEMSNVNAVSEMVNLINGYRAYEVNAKAVQAHDQLLDKAVNEVGKI